MMADERPAINELGRDQILERVFDRNGGFLYVALTNSNGDRSIVDNVSNSLVGVDFWNHKIHQGQFYQTNAVDLSMSINDTLALAFKTPDSETHAHMVVDFVTNGDAHLDIIENPTWDVQSGSLAPIRNRLVTNVNVSDLLEDQAQALFTADGNLIKNPVNLAGGTILDTTYTFTEVPKGEGGDLAAREWILAPNRRYAARVTSDQNNNKAQLKISWYEHVNVN